MEYTEHHGKSYQRTESISSDPHSIAIEYDSFSIKAPSWNPMITILQQLCQSLLENGH
jgi:hypothetical protein